MITNFWMLVYMMCDKNFGYEEREAFISFLQHHLVEKGTSQTSPETPRVEFPPEFWDEIRHGNKIAATKELRSANRWMSLGTALDIINAIMAARKTA